MTHKPNLLTALTGIQEHFSFLFYRRGAVLLSHLSAFLLVLAFSNCSNKMSQSVRNESAGLNGNFEYSEQGKPVNWMFYTSETTGSGDFDIILDSINPKEGKHTLTYIVRSCDAKGGRFSPGMAQEIAVEPGKNYRISFWTQNNGTDHTIKVNAVNAFNQAAGVVHKPGPGTHGWQFYSYEYKIPEAMEKLRFELNILSPGTFSIDDIRIEKI